MGLRIVLKVSITIRCCEEVWASGVMVKLSLVIERSRIGLEIEMEMRILGSVVVDMTVLSMSRQGVFNRFCC